MSEEQVQAWRIDCKASLRRKFSDDDEDIVEEYIGEAEHQDGYGYWDQFGHLEELYSDFTTYKDARGFVEGDLNEKGERVFSSHKAALPYLSLKWSSLKLEMAMYRPNRMYLSAILRDDDNHAFRIGGDVIHEFQLTTWKEVLQVAGQLWRISRRIK